MNRPEPSPEELRKRLHRLGLHGLLTHWDEIATQPWLPQLLAIEEAERQRRSLDRRIRDSRTGSFKPMADFDWQWPTKIDRQAIDELFSLAFIPEGVNAIFLGPNGVGKSMILQNLAHHALVRGYTVRFVSASDMLAELAAQDSSSVLARRLRRYVLPALLCIDEVGYLSYSNRYADLLFEVVTRRYDARRPVLLSTNKAFSEWTEVFPHAACTVTLVDRLIHRSEIIEIEGQSYRLKEAKERAAQRKSARRRRSGRA
jgi:DNA replication protein DnaC